MGLLTRKNPSSALHKWLNKVDEAYTEAFETLDVANVAQYLANELASCVSEKVRRGGKEYSGLTKYRHINWKKETETSVEIIMRKVVTYDHIKVTRGIIAPVGLDYEEKWHLSKNGGEYLVTNIRRL